MDQSPRGDRHLPSPRDGDHAVVPGAGSYLVFDEAESPQSPLQIIPFLGRRLWTILGAALVVLLATAAFTYMQPTQYRSSSTVLVESAGSAGTPLEVLQLAEKTSTLETEIQLMRSRRVVERAVKGLGWHARVRMDQRLLPARDVFPSFEAGDSTVPGTYRIVSRQDGGYEVRGESGQVIASGKPGSTTIQFAGITVGLPEDFPDEGYMVDVRPPADVVWSYIGRVEALPSGRDSNILLLSCTGPTGESAYELCQAVSRSYMALRSELQRAQADAATEFLEEQLQQVAIQLRAAEDSLKDYQERNLAVSLQATAASEVQQYASFRAERDRMAAERASLRQLINQIEAGGGGQGRDFASLPTFIQSGNPVIGNLLGSLVELENQRSQLAKTRTERNPDIVAIDTRIAEIESQLKSMANNYDQALSAQINSLGAVVGQASGRMAAIPEKQVATDRLTRQVTLLDSSYRQLQTQLADARMAQSISMPAVRIVDEASLPGGPFSPNWPINLLLGGVLGLGFGLALAFLQEHLDNRVRERKEIEKETGVAVLAMLPTMKNPGPILPLSRGVDGSVAIQVQPDLSHELAREAFWSLVTDLRFAAGRIRNGGLNSVAVTSSTRGEGKTFSACNLALAQANTSMRTLLIDADFRGKGVSRFFRLDSMAPGLAEVLSGAISAEQAWRPVTVDGRGELHVLPAGNTASGRSKMMDAAALTRLIADAESQFDLVVVDTPPLNIVSDAAAVAANVDGVIVVVRGGFTDRAALDFTLHRLRRTEVHVLGLVLNDVDLPEYYTSYSHSEAES